MTTWLNFSGVRGARTEAKLPPEETAKALEPLSELLLKDETGDERLRLADEISLEDSLSAITSIVALDSTDGMREGDDGVIAALKFSVSPNF